MTGVGLFLLAVGIADLVAGGLAGEPSKGLRSRLAVVAGVLLLGSGGWLAGADVGPILGLSALLLATLVPWLGLRSAGQSPERAWWALTALATGTLLSIALSPLWTAAGRPALEAWIDAVPFAFVAESEVRGLLLLAGIATFLTATGNGIVRAVLQGAGTEFRRSEQRLRGGRLIGVIERYLVFGLAVAGEPTAAALVVSAKSLLRFPELTRVAQAPGEVLPSAGAVPRARLPEVDYVTEYFLLGSLVSWMIALLPALLFAAPS